MSEKKEGFFSQIKNQIIAGIGIVITTLGTLFVDEVKSIVGIGGDEETQTEVIKENTQNQSVNVEGPTIVVNIPEAKKDTVVKKIYVKPTPPKPKKEDVDW